MQDLWKERKSLESADFRLSAVIFYEKAPTACLTDYELELEYTADYPEKPLEILKNAGITQGEAVIGKYARFMERAKKLGKC